MESFKGYVTQTRFVLPKKTEIPSKDIRGKYHLCAMCGQRERGRGSERNACDELSHPYPSVPSMLPMAWGRGVEVGEGVWVYEKITRSLEFNEILRLEPLSKRQRHTTCSDVAGINRPHYCLHLLLFSISRWVLARLVPHFMRSRPQTHKKKRRTKHVKIVSIRFGTKSPQAMAVGPFHR